MSKNGKKSSKSQAEPTSGTEPRASDLLPPDGPPPTDPRAVRASDADFEPDVETRKIGIRRVSSLDFGNRMYARLNRRSAGNSRSFWRNIEADDPFMKAPARPTDAPLEIYPAQRIDRTSGSLPKPQPNVARAYPPEPGRSRSSDEPAGNRPKPMREAKRTPRPDTTTESRTTDPPPKPRREAKRPRPEPTHTPEPRPAPTPTPPEPDPEPVAAAPTPPEPGRRLPPKPSNPKKKSGRIRTGRQRMPSKASAPQQRKSAAEIRAEKQKLRDIAMDKEPELKPSKDLDMYRQFVQTMEIQQAAHEAGLEIPTAFADAADEPIRRPKPKGEVKREKPKPASNAPAGARKASPSLKAAAAAAASGKRPPQPKAESPPVDRTPPKPKQKARPDKPVNRSPSGGGGGGLDDLFGGGAQEGRLSIGKRSKPKPQADNEGADAEEDEDE